MPLPPLYPAAACPSAEIACAVDPAYPGGAPRTWNEGACPNTAAGTPHAAANPAPAAVRRIPRPARLIQVTYHTDGGGPLLGRTISAMTGSAQPVYLSRLDCIP